MITHIKKLAIIEDANPNNVVVLSNISEGVDGASTFGYSTEETVLTIEDGQTIHDAIEHTLDVRTIVPDMGDSQLQTWTDNLTPVYVSAIGLDGGLLIGDATTGEGAVRFYADDQFSDRKAIKILATRKTIPGYDSDTGIFENGIWAGRNLLGGYEWDDKDGDGIADGWEAEQFVSTSFSIGQQSLTTDGVTDDNFVRDIYFPFEGEQLTFSVNIDTYNTIDELIIFIREFDVDGINTAIASESISSSGRHSVTHTTTEGGMTSKISVSIRLNNSTTGTTVEEVVSDPTLQIGTKTTYTSE